MITIQQFKTGMASYLDREIADKASGLKKWAVSLVAVSMMQNIDRLIEENKALLISSGYMMQDGMIDADRLLADLKTVANKKGEVVQDFPIIGAIRFNEGDIDSLRRYMNG